MQDTRWVVIDTETDGLHGQICTVEIAAQLMDGYEPVGTPFQAYLNHNVPISTGAQAIHGYSQEFLQIHGLAPRDAHERFRAYVGNLPIASHNLSFDWDRVLAPEWLSLEIPPIGRRGFCLLDLARRLVCESPNYSLDALRDVFMVECGKRHNAQGDVEALVDLFQRIYRPRLERARVHTFGAWTNFSTATPIKQCWARALSSEEQEGGLKMRENLLAHRTWKEVDDEFFTIGRQTLYRQFRRILKRTHMEGQFDPREATYLFRIFELFPRLQTHWPGLYVFKWFRDHAPQGVLLESQHPTFHALLERIAGRRPRLVVTAPNQKGTPPIACSDPPEKAGVITGSADAEAKAESSASMRLPFDHPSSVVFSNRLFCFTGKFAFGTRSQCERAVIERGGRCSRRPVGGTDYLVVGSLGEFGSKVGEIEALKRSGSPVQLLSEKQWSGAVKSTPREPVLPALTAKPRQPRRKNIPSDAAHDSGGISITLGFKDGSFYVSTTGLPDQKPPS